MKNIIIINEKTLNSENKAKAIIFENQNYVETRTINYPTSFDKTEIFNLLFPNLREDFSIQTTHLSGRPNDRKK
jgi:hypothetical protein